MRMLGAVALVALRTTANHCPSPGWPGGTGQQFDCLGCQPPKQVAYPPHTTPPWPGGGWPASPFASWGLRNSTLINFIANTTGPMSDAFLLNASTLGIVGLGWQAGDQLATDPAKQIDPKCYGKLEEWQRGAAAQLKALRPGIKVIVSADIACTARFWNVSSQAMANTTLLDELFLHWPTGEVFLDAWGGAPSPWWNYSNPAATKFWIEQGPIAQAMNDPLIDGVYLDGADMGNRHGIGSSAWTCKVFANQAQQACYIADSQAALAQAVSYWRKQQPHKLLTGYVSSRMIDQVHVGQGNLLHHNLIFRGVSERWSRVGSGMPRHPVYFAPGNHISLIFPSHFQGRNKPNDEAFHCPPGACAGPTQLAPVKGKRGTIPNRLCATTMRGLIARST